MVLAIRAHLSELTHLVDRLVFERSSENVLVDDLQEARRRIAKDIRA